MKITIIDYGLGNLRSVLGAIEKLGHEAIITNDISKIEISDKLILPGVGAFGDGISNLKKLNLINPLNDIVLKRKKPILAICLGFQLLSNISNEFGTFEGLGWVDASVSKLDIKDKNLRVPHIGWNNHYKKKSPLLDGIPKDALFYYVHSYRMICEKKDIVIGECLYGYDFIAAIQKDNIYGTQFHPEKVNFMV